MHPARNGERFCAAVPQHWVECCVMPSVSYSKTAAQCNTELYVRNLMEIISAGLYSAYIYIKGSKNVVKILMTLKRLLVKILLSFRMITRQKLTFFFFQTKIQFLINLFSEVHFQRRAQQPIPIRRPSSRMLLIEHQA